MAETIMPSAAKGIIAQPMRTMVFQVLGSKLNMGPLWGQLTNLGSE